MRLEEYVALKKIIDRKFQIKHFCARLRISANYYQKITKGGCIPSLKVAQDIERITEGNVTISDVLYPEKTESLTVFIKNKRAA